MTRRRIVKKTDLVLGRIMGGLGNQLFIIFTTIAYSLEHNMDYDIVNIERVRKTYFDSLYKNLKNSDKKYTDLKNFNEKDFTYTPIPKEKRIALYGYFQSYKYFEKYKDKIIDMLKLMDYKAKNAGTREAQKYEGFLHFRIGDYKNTDCHPVCDIDYYIEALNDISSDISREEIKFVYYFEEENREEVEEKIDILKKKFSNFSFHPVDTKLKDYEQLLSMTDMKYCIIANSSFSWWGAYLNKTPGKKVYYPRKWFAGSLKDYNTKDLIPVEWKNYYKSRDAYVLTTDKTSDRAIFSKNLLEKIGFNVILFEAIKDEYPMVSHRKSMYAIYEKILETGKEGYYYVFEDDINTLLDVDLEYIINYEKLNQDILYLGCCYNGGEIIKTDKIVNEKKMSKIKGGIRGIHSLAMNKKGVKLLKKLYDDNPKSLHMDVLLEKYSLENPLYLAREDLISPCCNSHLGIFYQDRDKFKSQLDSCKYY